MDVQVDERLREVGRGIEADAVELARQVTARWAELAREEPWLEPVTRLGQDNLPNLIRAIARVALVEPEVVDAAEALIDESRAHGEARRSEGHPGSVIPSEYLLLRRALRHILVRRARTSPHLLLPLVALLETAIGVAEIGSLHGYHADEDSDDARGDARLLEEWSGLVHEVLEGG